MGRFGGHEMSYGSDADVMFVHDPLPGADEREAGTAAHTVVAGDAPAARRCPVPTRRWSSTPTCGRRARQGPLVRTLASYAAYYRRWSLPWEAQALLRAEPVAGDADLGARVHRRDRPSSGTRTAASPRPVSARSGGSRPGWKASACRAGSTRRCTSSSAPAACPTSSGPSSCSSCGTPSPWPGLRTTRTLPALAAAREAGLINAPDAAVLAEAWQLAARIRDAVMLVRGTAGDTLPTAYHELGAVARILGYGPGEGQALVQDYRRAARRARTVMDRLFRLTRPPGPAQAPVGSQQPQGVDGQGAAPFAFGRGGPGQPVERPAAVRRAARRPGGPGGP